MLGEKVRNEILDVLYTTDRLCRLFIAAREHRPDVLPSAQQALFFDIIERAAQQARALLDDDSQARGPRLQHVPTPPEAQQPERRSESEMERRHAADTVRTKRALHASPRRPGGCR